MGLRRIGEHLIRLVDSMVGSAGKRGTRAPAARR
jgi:hypothetical protein